LVGWDGPRVVSLKRNNPGLDDGTPLAFTACASRRAGADHAHATAIASRRAMAPAARTPIDPSPPSDSTPPANAAARRHNPNGIESSSPGLPAAGYPGNTPPQHVSTLKGLNHRTNDVRFAPPPRFPASPCGGDATPLGLMILCERTQGRCSCLAPTLG